MSCGANHSRRVGHALERRSVHTGRLAEHTAKRKSSSTRPAKKKTPPKKSSAPSSKTRSKASRTASATARAHARAKAHATASAHARATARAHALAKLKADRLKRAAERRQRHLDWLHCHRKKRHAAPRTGGRSINTHKGLRPHSAKTARQPYLRPWRPRTGYVRRVRSSRVLGAM